MNLNVENEVKLIDSQSTADKVICRMSEFDLLRNINTGKEYTGFKKLYRFNMLEKNHVSDYGMVYDVTNSNIYEHHLLKYLNELLNEKPSHIIMTSGTFLNMNKSLQREVIRYLIELSKGERVTIYAGIDINHFFINTNVEVKSYNRINHFIIHFIKSKYSFNFVMPHTEDKLIRVDLNSRTFKPKNKERVLSYFDKLVSEFDKII